MIRKTCQRRAEVRDNGFRFVLDPNEDIRGAGSAGKVRAALRIIRSERLAPVK